METRDADNPSASTHPGRVLHSWRRHGARAATAWERVPYREDITGFWNKINNDWIFNLAGLLAFNLILAAIPLLLIILAIGVAIFSTIDPATQVLFLRNIANAFPSGTGTILVESANENLHHSVGFFVIFGVLSAMFFGSRLFIVIENCFGIIFRLRPRDLIPQNTMAFALLTIYLIVVPLSFAISTIPTYVLRLTIPSRLVGVTDAALTVSAFIGSVALTFIIFVGIYAFVPNCPPRWRFIWPGTVVASVLLVLYEQLFPFYVSVFLRPQNLGSIVGFILVIFLFVYYIAFILLLGAEINSWQAGQRETAGDIQVIYHQIQAHRTLDGAAGPTAGLPDEDLVHQRGAENGAQVPHDDRHAHTREPVFYLLHWLLEHLRTRRRADS